MKQICALTCRLLSCPAVVAGAVVLVSFTALAAALTAEVALGLEPCILCIYQRIPFAAALILGLAALALRNKTQVFSSLVLICAALFLVNAGIAFYHTGVELHWWISAVEGCAVPAMGGNPQSVLENILSAPTARCDEIPWADPVLGLSMANYNVMLCFGMFVFCLLGGLMRCREGSACP